MENAEATAELRGKVENVLYRNDANDYTVLELSTDADELVTAVGFIPVTHEGECVVLRGRYIFHKEFGRQVSFDTFEKTLPVEEEGIVQYLSSGTIKGIGPVTALKIVRKFGKDSFDVIENHPEWLAEIPGITEKKAAGIAASFKEQTGLRDVMMFCKGHFAVGEVSRVYKRFGSGAVGLIRDNPYILCEVFMRMTAPTSALYLAPGEVMTSTLLMSVDFNCFSSRAFCTFLLLM